MVCLTNGRTCKVKKELGRGGQGIVYAVDYVGKDHALNWYTGSGIINSKAYYENLNNIVNAGSPAPNFIWPLAITERQKGGYGYVMCLRPQGYAAMGEFLLYHAQFGSVQAQLNACLQVSMAFKKLHGLGLCMHSCDPSFFYINPVTGDVLVKYDEAMSPDDVDLHILGNNGYMAPEIVEGKATPNVMADNHTLAICLFRLIYFNHPFEGQWYFSCPCDNNPENAKKLFGFSSVFIMDPTDAKNRPVRGCIIM